MWGRLEREGSPDVVLDVARFEIGRSTNCNLCLADSLVVSFNHCYVEIGSEGEISITDVSTNGTFINSKRIPKRTACVLKDGDSVALASKKETAPKFVFRLVHPSTGTQSAKNIRLSSSSPYAVLPNESRRVIENNAESLATLYRSNEDYRKRLKTEKDFRAKVASDLERERAENRRLREELGKAEEAAASLREARAVDLAAQAELSSLLDRASRVVNRGGGGGAYPNVAGDTQLSCSEEGGRVEEPEEEGSQNAIGEDSVSRIVESKDSSSSSSD